MIKKIKKCTLCFIGFIILAGFFYVDAKIRLNDIQPAFAENTKKAIDSNMTLGAKLNFVADSYFNLFLAEVENGENYILMLKYLYLTSQQLLESYNFYNVAYNIGKESGYYKGLMEKYKGFDYNSISNDFQFEKIFNEVSNCFKNNNILGIYKRNLDYILNIRAKINLLNTKIKNKILDIKEIQNITILMYDNGIFGNYATQINNLIMK